MFNICLLVVDNCNAFGMFAMDCTFIPVDGVFACCALGTDVCTAFERLAVF